MGKGTKKLNRSRHHPIKIRNFSANKLRHRSDGWSQRLFQSQPDRKTKGCWQQTDFGNMVWVG